MKVFLSHPMHGLDEAEVMKLRNEVHQRLIKIYGDDIEIIDNYHHENVPENAGRLWHLGTSIRLMEQADAVYFCGDYYNSKGCRIEAEICRRYGLRILNII